MGNSSQAWSKKHALQLVVREAHAAVDAMQTWRQHLLARRHAVEAPPKDGCSITSASHGSDIDRCIEGIAHASLP